MNWHPENQSSRHPFFANLVPRWAADQNLRVRGIGEGLFPLLFANANVKIVDNWGVFRPSFFQSPTPEGI